MRGAESEKIRAFIAVAIPEDVRRAAAKLIGEGRGSLKGVSWVEPGNLHVTLKFLGQTPASLCGEICRRIRLALEGTRPFHAGFRGVGAFPGERRPRILFIRMEEGEREMADLSRVVEDAVESLGFERERRDASPHLTVGRVRNPGEAGALPHWLEANRERRFGSCEVGEVILFRSDLRPSGAVYSIVDTCVFRV